MDCFIILPNQLFNKKYLSKFKNVRFFIFEEPLLFGDKEKIRTRIDTTFSKCKDRKYILNLGHGILPVTLSNSLESF